MELGWVATLQAVAIALSTWSTVYLRRKSKEDKDTVIQSTAAQSTSNEILVDVRALKADVELLKIVVLADKPINHQGPARPKE